MMEDSRISWLRSRGAQIGSGVFFGPDVYIEHDFAPLLIIEDGVVLARGVSIFLHDSSLNNVLGEPLRFGRVILRRYCYIGANSTILCGVEVGEHAIVGAASLVIHSIPGRSLAYGHPARVHGTVEDLAAKHVDRRRRDRNSHYLDLLPWRDRRVLPDGGMAIIQQFVAEIANEPPIELSIK